MKYTKKVNLFFFLLILILFNLFKLNAEKPAVYFRLQADLNAMPYFYEFKNQLNCIAINGSFAGGAKINDFTISLKLFENYFSLGIDTLTDPLIGAFSLSHLTMLFQYFFTPYIELNWGIGGVINKSAFNYNNTKLISQFYGGLSLSLDLSVFPAWQYFSLKFLNQMDIFFYENGVLPYYLGGLRFNFYPNIKWFNFYIDICGMPWIYQNDRIKTNTGFFLWSVGILFDKTFDGTNGIINTKQKVVEKKPPAKNNNKSQFKYGIDSLNTAKNDDFIFFPNITFVDNTTKFTKEAYKELKIIVNILKTRKDLNFLIGGYSNYLKNAINELELAINRAKMIKDYLVKAGIDEKRLGLLAKGNINYSLYLKRDMKDKFIVIFKIKIDK